VVAAPYALSPTAPPNPSPGDERDLDSARYDGDLRMWTGPWANGTGLAVRAVRALLSQLLPAPGHGPGEHTRRTGFFPHAGPGADLGRSAGIKSVIAFDTSA